MITLEQVLITLLGFVAIAMLVLAWIVSGNIMCAFLSFKRDVFNVFVLGFIGLLLACMAVGAAYCAGQFVLSMLAYWG